MRRRRPGLDSRFRGIQSQSAGSKLVEFQTGHFMMAEDPERFRTVLGDFLRSLK
jgi:hypothetical protein